MDSAETGPFDLASQRLGALPLVNHFLDRAGLPALLGRYLPTADARVRLAPAVAVRLVVTNLLIGRQPLYALGEWAAPFAPGLLGLAGHQPRLEGEGQHLAQAVDLFLQAQHVIGDVAE